MDCVSIFPQHERVKNYIDFIHAKKMQELDQHMQEIKKSLFESNDPSQQEHQACIPIVSNKRK